MRILPIVLVFVLLSAPAFGFDKLFAKHCKTYGVPKDIATAIAKQESAMNPLCVNVAGQDYWPETRAEAEAIIRKAQKKDLSYDVGLMQINSQWIKQWKIDPTVLLDPDVNIRYGTRILKNEISRNGLNWRAVASYHSPDPERGRRYALMVYNRLKGKAEARAIMVNPRLKGGSMFFSRKYKNFRFGSSADSSLLTQVNSMRKPVGVN